ncbi:methyltransferase, FkbM family [Flavobacterium gillisiae]|uniref:Methyltransferase, FkbM family n=1 Tax=Flavobacterium gillisiae TaxID=150146 RepID=A0A1H4EVP6_9FLAO|nr:FkbM family methyltransferase [Flavobacterium gillisiae]SEA89061.1 methyltransferase, FkbM family [Flavobacterium gillisiae]
MIKWLYNTFKIVSKNIQITKKSKYKFKEKIIIFNILNSLYFKSVFFKNKNEVTQDIFQFKVTAYNYNTLLFLYKEIFISNDYFFKADNSIPKIIDCGANIGMSILYFKFIYPNCSIVAFEPNPKAFYLLKKNVEQNNLKNVVLHNLALSDNRGKIDFFIGNDEEILLASTIAERGGEENFKIESDKLSNYLNDTIDLIKIDIEGSENQVLNDLVLSDKIKSTKNYIIEYHHRINNRKSSLSSFIKPFEESGFEYNIKSSFYATGVFQDILLNIYKEKLN